VVFFSPPGQINTGTVPYLPKKSCTCCMNHMQMGNSIVWSHSWYLLHNIHNRSENMWRKLRLKIGRGRGAISSLLENRFPTNVKNAFQNIKVHHYKPLPYFNSFVLINFTWIFIMLTWIEPHCSVKCTTDITVLPFCGLHGLHIYSFQTGRFHKKDLFLVCKS
jgi:hypothetical protein